MGWMVVATIFGVLQLGSVGRVRVHTQEPPEEPAAARHDAAVNPHGREPSWGTAAPAETHDQPVETTTPRPAVPREPERAPWWVYAVPISIIVLVFSRMIVRPKPKRERDTLPPRFHLSNVPPAPSLPTGQTPKSSAEYATYLGNDLGEAKRVLPEGALPRTKTECQAIYLEGLEALVKRMVWPERVTCQKVDGAPIEMQYQAWLGDGGWDRAIVRACGFTAGMALKGLLRSYGKFGGRWIAHAMERSTKDRPATTTSASIRPVSAVRALIGD